MVHVVRIIARWPHNFFLPGVFFSFGINSLVVKHYEIIMETYTRTLENVGEAILGWSDPENKYRGFTEVSEVNCSVV